MNTRVCFHILESVSTHDRFCSLKTRYKKYLPLFYFSCLVFLVIVIASCSFLSVCASWVASYHLVFHAIAYGLLCFLLFAILSHIRSRPIPVFWWWQGALACVLVTTFLGMLHTHTHTHFWSLSLHLIRDVYRFVGGNTPRSCWQTSIHSRCFIEWSRCLLQYVGGIFGALGNNCLFM